MSGVMTFKSTNKPALIQMAFHFQLICVKLCTGVYPWADLLSQLFSNCAVTTTTQQPSGVLMYKTD